MIVLLTLISLLNSDQSLKFSIVEAGALVGGVDTVKKEEEEVCNNRYNEIFLSD